MIKSVQKAIDILFYLSNTPEEAIPLTQIAAALSMNKSTCSHLLDTLCESLMVEHVSRKEGYRLGPSAYLLTRYGRYQESLIEVCSPIIKWIRHKLDATIFLTVVCDGTKYIILHEIANELPDVNNTEITKGSIEDTASGLLMIAYMDHDSLDRVRRRSSDIERFSKDLKAREKYFHDIRENGFVRLYDGKNDRYSYAFRISKGSRTVASIAILCSASQDNPHTRNRIIKYGKLAAKEISRRLEFEEHPLNTGI